jgi:DNA-binding LytR/AlgR family response regulator
MWCEMCLLVMVIIVLWCEIYNLRKIIQQTEDTDSTITQQNRYKFYDEKGDLKLVVQPEMLFYLESADNYVIIHYMNSGKMEKIIIRNTLKNIEWRLQDTNVVRCHRSYLVNLNNVQLIRRKEGDMLLDFGNEKIEPIPISKTYSDKVLKHFSE